MVGVLEGRQAPRIFIPLGRRASPATAIAQTPPGPTPEDIEAFRQATFGQMSDAPQRNGIGSHAKLDRLIASKNIPYDALRPEQLAALASYGDQEAARVLLGRMNLPGIANAEPEGAPPQTGTLRSALANREAAHADRAAAGMPTPTQYLGPAGAALREGWARHDARKATAQYSDMGADERAAMGAPLASAPPRAPAPLVRVPAQPRGAPVPPIPREAPRAPMGEPDLEPRRSWPSASAPADMETADRPPAPQSPAPPGGGDRLTRDMVLRIGLGLMAQGSVPGQSLGGALGAAGIDALRHQDAQREKQGAAALREREFALQTRKVDQDAREAQLRLSQLAEDKRLDRDLRREMGERDADMKKLLAQAQSGNQAALIELREETLRANVDAAAAEHKRETMKRLTEANTFAATPVSESQMSEMADREVARLFPESSFARRHAQRERPRIQRLDQPQALAGLGNVRKGEIVARKADGTFERVTEAQLLEQARSTAAYIEAAKAPESKKREARTELRDSLAAVGLSLE